MSSTRSIQASFVSNPYESKPTQPRKSSCNIFMTKMGNAARWTKKLGLVAVQCIFNPSLTYAFFTGPLYSNIPHVRAKTPLGHLSFTPNDTEQFTKAAKEKGIATYWSGPFFPALYVTNNDVRRALIRESQMGITDNKSKELLNWMWGENGVMNGFILFHSIHSKTYQDQRDFLLKRFHGGAEDWLIDIAHETERFLEHYHQTQDDQPRSLREFITALVLRTSSHLLGLTQTTLDVNYFDDKEYRDAINRVARYGIGKSPDPVFENILYKIFLRILENNFEKILTDTPQTNLIRNIFASMNVEFPEKFGDFFKLPMKLQHAFAMNFAATGIGAMVHSTANTLDWALARLLNNPNKMEEFIQLGSTLQGVKLADKRIFDKSDQKEMGQLYPITEWVLRNVFLKPPFSHEFFYNSKSFVTTFSVTQQDGSIKTSTLKVPSKSFIIVNYVECNRSNVHLGADEKFSDSLQDSQTIGKFMSDPKVASFGGSKISRDNKFFNTKTRVCPAAKTSLYEQVIMIAILFRDYVFRVTSQISCDVDPKDHPLCVRVNRGEIVLNKLEKQRTAAPRLSF